MKRLITALVLVPLALLAVFRASAGVFTIVCALVALFATVEYLQIVEQFGHKVFRAVTYCLLLLSFFALEMIMSPLPRVPQLAPVFLIAMLTLFAPAVYLMAGMRSSELKDAVPGAALSMFGLPYIGGGFAALALLHAMSGGWFFVLLVCAAVWVGDSAAYYVGKRWGRHKFSPVISPNKTWEGAAASIVGAMIVVAAFGWFAPQVEQGLRWAHLLPADTLSMTGEAVGWRMLRAPIWLGCLIGAVVNAGAQLGDLFESMIKRGAGVKDSGTILPGHGGVLDRIDALLFAAPVALALFFFVAQWMVRLAVIG